MLGEGEKTHAQREGEVDGGDALSLFISVAFKRGVNGRAWPTRLGFRSSPLWRFFSAAPHPLPSHSHHHALNPRETRGKYTVKKTFHYNNRKKGVEMASQVQALRCVQLLDLSMYVRASASVHLRFSHFLSSQDIYIFVFDYQKSEREKQSLQMLMPDP